MKKFLIIACITSLTSVPTFAADTYTESFIDSLFGKVNKVAAPVVDKEKQLQEKQKAAQELKQKQLDEKQKALEAQQKAQQELIEKKKQEIQTQKDFWTKEKELWKSIFSFK